MKAVILAGGLGTRLSEVTQVIPKPMVEIGGRPILWHILKIYSAHGVNDFIICCGYKGYAIKEYFANYFRHTSDLIVNLKENSIELLNNNSEPWSITLVDTGLSSMTGSRVKKIQKYLDDETFLLTYGDGVGDVDISESIINHKKSGKILSVTAYRPEGRFGALDIQTNGDVSEFREKPIGDGSWINAGFFVCEPSLFDYLPENENLIFEKEPMEKLALDGKMRANKHYGFWKPMDTMRDNLELNNLWENDLAPWKVW
jgi:glucose-1-phosphate cytidylyltransferase